MVWFRYRDAINRLYSHKLLTINNYIHCPPDFAYACSICLFHPPIFKKILMRIRSIVLPLSMLYMALKGPATVYPLHGSQRSYQSSTLLSTGPATVYALHSSQRSYHRLSSTWLSTVLPLSIIYIALNGPTTVYPLHGSQWSCIGCVQLNCRKY